MPRGSEIERRMRAVCDRMPSEVAYLLGPYLEASVRAMLEALREPSAATVYAGIVAQRSRRPDWHYEPEVTEAVFVEMIDAILNEGRVSSVVQPDEKEAFESTQALLDHLEAEARNSPNPETGRALRIILKAYARLIVSDLRA